MVQIVGSATAAPLGGQAYQRFSSLRPAVAHDDEADPRDQAFAVARRRGKILFTRTLDRRPGATPRIAAAGPAGTVRQLRGQDGGDIIHRDLL
jgi:hypothetical protein